MDRQPAAAARLREVPPAPGAATATAAVTATATAVPSPRAGLVFPQQLAADGRALACRVRRAVSFAERGRGLLWRAPLRPGQALWILPCPSIHTVGMTYAIDVVFLNVDGRVLRVAADVRPLRFRMCRGAVSVVELLAGQAAALDITAGQRLTALPAASDIPAASVPHP